MKTYISLIIMSAVLAGCASVSESIPTVKIEKRKSKTTVQTANFISDATSNQEAMICETSEMRRKVIDDNDKNDAVRVMVVEDGDTGSRVLSEVEVDCRTYFLKKTLSPAKPTIIHTAAPVTQVVQSPRRSTRLSSPRYTYIVQSGDTVWDIAKEHCTTVKAITRLNGLGRGNILDIGQRLKLPDETCN